MDAQTWDALVESMKSAYSAGLAEGAVPRPVIMPLVRGELVGLIWVRPTEPGKDALTGIAELANIAAAAAPTRSFSPGRPTTSPPPASCRSPAPCRV